MEAYGKILTIAIPIFFLLVILEKLYGWYWKKESFKTMDMLSSLSSGFTNIIKDVLGLSVSILSYEYMVTNWAVFEIKSTFGVYFIAFIALDFYGYWTHRLAHQVNFFWNKHAIHHSSEEFNLACALRQSISSFVNLFTFFLLPAALLGVPAQVIAIVAPLHLFAQFWYHTVYIGKMGFLEKIIVTPSHHRVHHAINPEYLDRNHGQIFIFWDKLFGTYQEELPDVPPVYGITRPVSTWNPIKINFQHLWLLVQDAYRANNWKDKFTIWFKPTGWRPADVEAKYPIHKIENPYSFEKYNSFTTMPFVAWIWVQFLTTLTVIYYLLYNIATIGNPAIFIYGGFILLCVYAYSELMDRNPNAFWWELLKTATGFYLMYVWGGDWFGAGQVFTLFLIISWIVALPITYYFSRIENISAKIA